MSKIVVDCDLVLAASDKAWLDWLRRVCQPYLTSKMYSDIELGFKQNNLDYDLAKYFKEALDKLDRDGFDFWRGTTCYDHVNPTEGSVKAIQQLKEDGHEIAVVSAIKGNHSKSKYQFLKRHYGDNIDAFIWTKEKNWVDCDYFIDDRNKFLNLSNPKKAKIKVISSYTQCEELEVKDVQTWTVSTWDEIYQLIHNCENHIFK